MIRSCDPQGLRCGCARRTNETGFTLLELVLVIAIVGVLVTVALERLLYYQERVEQTAMEETLSAFKMGLQVRLAEMMMSNATGFAGELERENPVRWLDRLPSNYLGEYVNSPKTGNWYFATQGRQLVYVPYGTSYLQGGQPGNRELRFQARVTYFDVETPTGKARVPSGISLAPVQQYRWF